MTASGYLEAIRQNARRISEVAGDGALGARVPHMETWEVRDVVAHLGAVHRWAARIVTTGGWDKPTYRSGDLDGAALIDWFEEGAESLVDTLERTPADQPCWNFSRGTERVASFWSRRQAHETGMHRWDVEAAVGAAERFPPSVAADGVDEVLRVFVRRSRKMDLAGSVGFRCEDVDAGWRLWRPDPEGAAEVDDYPGSGPAPGAAAADANHPGRTDDCDVELCGPACDLLLLLWGRRPIEGTAVTVTGNDQIATRLLESKLTP